MSTLSDLRRLIGTGKTAQTGVVVSVTATALQVSTRSGVKTLRRVTGDATNYRAGDTVRISGDTVSGRLQARERYIL